MSAFKKEKQQAIGYFSELPKGTQAIVKEMIESAFQQNCEVFCDELQEIEYESRPGFIPFNSNHGGLEMIGFTDLMQIWGSGTYPAHKKAKEEIERQIEYGLKCASENFLEKKQAVLNALGICTPKQVSYHTLYEMGQTKLAEELSEYENENLSGESDSIMYSIRFLYHGKVNGKHSASVSAAVNTEGPYHRSRISWAPNVFCEGAKEIEIEWSNQTELKQKLKKTLDKVCKEVL